MTPADKLCVNSNARPLPAEYEMSSVAPDFGAGAGPSLKVTNRADWQVFGCRRLKLPASTQDLDHMYKVGVALRVIGPREASVLRHKALSDELVFYRAYATTRGSADTRTCWPCAKLINVPTCCTASRKHLKRSGCPHNLPGSWLRTQWLTGRCN